ncbi:hypothetical protein IQ265_06560 [Nodosilinea sp. LEGE 06152]|uniref:hypothetical protein n=1 Tax=Nodosilinea sp. LEGE 06152 TaxID=2777966 RepID=UPI00187E576F|nr:hypothetical protein [Nodosilinea sp. LEGE 06152]MBE9156491.1 hypothetical protein [Nodosilinea sp. LEGE 06152]
MHSTNSALYVATASTPSQTPVTPATPTGLDWTAILIPLLPAVATGVLVGLLSPMITPYVTWKLENKKRLQERNIAIINGVRSILDNKSNSVMDLSDFSDFGYIYDSFSLEEREHYRELKHKLIQIGHNYLKDKFIYKEAITQENLGPVKFSQLMARINGEDREEMVLALNHSAESHKIKKLIRQKIRELEYQWRLVGK